MSDNATAGELNELVATISVHLGAESTITHVDDDDGNWRVLVDSVTVATFDPDNELGASALSVTLRDKVDDLKERRDMVAGIRDLAAFLEEHPEVPVDNVWASKWGHSTTPEQFKAAADALRPIGFKLDEEPAYSRDEIALIHDFGPVEFKIVATADKICTTTVEVKEVTQTVAPDWARPPQDVVLTEVAA